MLFVTPQLDLRGAFQHLCTMKKLAKDQFARRMPTSTRKAISFQLKFNPFGIGAVCRMPNLPNQSEPDEGPLQARRAASRPAAAVCHPFRSDECSGECSLNYLEQRYARADRLAALPPFESLPHASLQSPYHGQVTLWEFVEGDWRRPVLVACLRPDFKPQHALWHAGRLWVLGVDRLEVYDASLRRVAEVSDPWLAGGHTAVPDGGGRLLLSCSASDSVLVVDEKTYAVVAAYRMPEASLRLELPPDAHRFGCRALRLQRPAAHPHQLCVAVARWYRRIHADPRRDWLVLTSTERIGSCCAATSAAMACVRICAPTSCSSATAPPELSSFLMTQ